MKRFLALLALSACVFSTHAEGVVICANSNRDVSFKEVAEEQLLVKRGYTAGDVFSKKIRVSYVGTGIILGKDENGVIIDDALPGSPAHETGLFGGVVYRIIAINGDIVVGKSITDISALIRGPVGTGVTLTITKVSGGRAYERYLERKVIKRTVEIPCIRMIPPKKN